MLTITFITPEKTKTVVSCASYNVSPTEGGTNIRAWDSISGDVSADFLVGEGEFEVAYVTNLAGKTIDRIGG